MNFIIEEDFVSDEKQGIITVSSCPECPFARMGDCKHPMGEGIVIAAQGVSIDCPMRGLTGTVVSLSVSLIFTERGTE